MEKNKVAPSVDVEGRTLGAKFSGAPFPGPSCPYFRRHCDGTQGTFVGFLTFRNDKSMRYYPTNEGLRYISAIYRTNESCSAAK